jgi:hypothetical protein
MKPTQVKEAIRHAVQAKRPVFIWGASGIGKSDIVSQLAHEFYGKKYPNGNYFIDLRLLLLDPVDLRGLPHLNGDNKAHWCQPDFLPSEGEGILFLDELNSAPPLVQASAYQLILNRKIGEYTLPQGWDIIAAGNRETDKAITHRMPSPLANRFIHLNFEVDNDDWIAWALTNNVRTDIISFIRHRPELLHSFDPQKNEKAFPTPRSWMFVSQLLDTNPSGAVKLSLIQGTVGEGAGAELRGYLDLIGKMPNVDEIIMFPDKVGVPKEPAILYALSTAIARKTTEHTIDNVCVYLKKMPPEFQVLTVRDAYQMNNDIVNTRAFIQWTSDNAEIFTG